MTITYKYEIMINFTHILERLQLDPDHSCWNAFIIKPKIKGDKRDAT